MNYQPYTYSDDYGIVVGGQDKRIIPLLTGFALGAPFWGSINRYPYYSYPYPYPYPYPIPYYPNFPYRRPYRRRRWY